MNKKYEISIFRTQLDMANALKCLIDRYWNFQINEGDFIERVRKIAELNEDKLFNSQGEMTSVISQRLGKRRIRLMLTIMSDME